MPNKSVALAKVPKTKPADSALALHNNSVNLVKAQRAVTDAMLPIKQYEALIKLALTGGKAAGWGFLSSGVSLGLCLAVHSAAFGSFGLAGLLVGLGIYGTRFFRAKTDKAEALQDELQDLKMLFAKGLLSEQQFNAAYAKALKRAGIL